MRNYNWYLRTPTLTSFVAHALSWFYYFQGTSCKKVIENARHDAKVYTFKCGTLALYSTHIPFISLSGGQLCFNLLDGTTPTCFIFRSLTLFSSLTIYSWPLKWKLGALSQKDEDHACTFDEDKSYDAFIMAETGAKDGKEYCIANFKDDCCKPKGGVIAGLVIGVLVGVAAIGYATYSFCCKKDGAPSMKK